jgi:hypothetical protein
VGRVEWKRPDQSFISGRPGDSIFHIIMAAVFPNFKHTLTISADANESE